MSINIPIGAKIEGSYKLQVVENGKVVEDRPWAKNMILNQGLNRLCSNTTDVFSDLFKYHAVGTGNAAVLATDTGLGNETLNGGASTRTNTYLVGAGNCGTSLVGSTINFLRTYDHAIETTPKNYTEHGLSWTSVVGNNLFTRALISGGTLTVLDGQQVRCVYQISVTVTPSTQTSLTVGGTGWPVSPATDCTGLYILGSLNYILGSINTIGNEQSFKSFLTASNTQKSCTCCTAVTLGAFGSGSAVTPIGNAVTYTLDSYVNDTFTFTYRPSAYVTAGEWSSTNINGWTWGQALTYKYSQAQTKADTHRLRMPSITITWTRS